MVTRCVKEMNIPWEKNNLVAVIVLLAPIDWCMIKLTDWDIDDCMAYHAIMIEGNKFWGTD